MRFSRDQLILKALAALNEIADECGTRPARRSILLRFTLAWLFVESGADPADKWLFTHFWNNATGPAATGHGVEWLDSYCRARDATSALNGICRAVGVEPSVSLFQAMDEARRRG